MSIKNSSSSSSSLITNDKVTMYHDGDCPLCNYEVNIMKKLDISKAIHWVDITKDKRSLDEAGISYQQAMDRVHVRDENNIMQTGVRGFLLVWKELPYYRRIVPIIEKVPFLLSTLEVFYSFFAKHRLKITGKASKR